MSEPSPDAIAENPPVRCEKCGTGMSPSMLSCPGCGRLTHAEALKLLAGEAEQAEAENDVSTALSAWRRALELLPPSTRQGQVIAARIEDLGRRASKSPKPEGYRAVKGLASLGAVGLLVWKFKFVAAFALTKAKFLLLGLTKASTFLSMFVSLGVYWAAFGWQFAAGVIVSIYIHEMGHVAALTRYGFRATAPMFIPGFGAVVRLRQHPTNPVENSRIGLAGPIWGVGAAIASLAGYAATEAPIWLAIARFGAWINLFNLIPIWQLDGGRGFCSLSRSERGLATASIAAAWLLTAEPMLILLLIAGAAQTWFMLGPEKPDRVGLVQYVALVAVLSALCQIDVPAPDGE